MHRRIEITPAAGLHQLCQNERLESDTRWFRTVRKPAWRSRIDPDRFSLCIPY